MAPRLTEDPRQMRRPGSEQARLAEAANEVDFGAFWRRVVEAVEALRDLVETDR